MNTHQKAVLNGIWHIALPDRSEGLIVNGVAIVGTFQGGPDLDIKSMAEALATAHGETLKRLYLPLPPLAQWAWSDIPDMMAHAARTTTCRCSVMVICSVQPGGRALHFCSHPVLSGSNHNLWFSVQDEETWFQAVERVMVMNHQAINVVRLEPGNSGVTFLDQRVIYNGQCVSFPHLC